MKRLCPECGEITEWIEKTQAEKFNIKDEEIEISVKSLVCPHCGSEFEDMNSEIDPYKLAYDEYRRRKGMVFPSQIINFRKKFGLTQKELSSLLGFGDITLSRYENGALQDEAHDQLLKFVLDPMNLLKLVKQKTEILSMKKREGLISKLEAERTIAFINDEISKKDQPGIQTGNREFNLEKLINLVKFFTFQNPVVKSKLLKLLFYADFKSFKETNLSITGLRYAHLPFGPVPDKYDLLIASIPEIDHAISMNMQLIGDYFGDVIVSSEPNETTIFNPTEEESIRTVHVKFKSYTAKTIEDFSHEEKGYKETRNGEIIAYSYANDLQI